MGPVALILNPKAGSSSAERNEALIRLLRERFELKVFETSAERTPDLCAREALAGGARMLLAAGGDGTVSAVAGELAGKTVPLGIVPWGTSNSFAAALGIPNELEAACEVLVHGQERIIDLARCNGRIMALHCSVGVHAETITETPPDAKKQWGHLAYLMTGLKKLAALEPFELELETEAHVMRGRAVTVTAANLAPRKTLVAQGPAEIVGDDGLIDVTVLAATSLVSAIATGIHLFRTAATHTAATRPEVGHFSCRSLKIRATPPQQVLIDGEDAGTTPVELECLPGSLRVLTPASPEG